MVDQMKCQEYFHGVNELINYLADVTAVFCGDTLNSKMTSFDPGENFRLYIFWQYGTIHFNTR